MQVTIAVPKQQVDRTRSRLTFWLVAYCIIALGIGSNIPTPLFVLYRSHWDISLAALTRVFAIYNFFVIPSMLLNGHLSDRFGRRRVMLTALLLGAVATALFASAQGVGMLYVAESLQGIAMGAFLGTATAALSELEADGNNRRAALVSSVSVAGGAACGPIFAGLLASYAPAPLVLPYLAHLLLLTPGLLLVRLLPERMGQPAIRPAFRLGVPAGIRARFAVSGLAGFTGWAVTGLFLATGPLVLAQLLGVKNLAVSAGIVFLMMGTSAATQMLLRRIRLASAMSLAMALLVLGMGLMALSFQRHLPQLFLLATLLSGMGAGLSSMSSLGTVNLIAPPDQRGGVVSSLFVLFYLGVSVPVVVLGWAADRWGLQTAAGLFGIVLSVVAALVWIVCSVPLIPGFRAKDTES
jgi:MFS family permease